MINKEEFIRSIRKDLGVELYEEMQESYCSDFSEISEISEDIFRKPSKNKEKQSKK